MKLDLDRVQGLLNGLHLALNVPNTANIQRALNDEIREINDDLAPEEQPAAAGQDEKGKAIPSAKYNPKGPETPTDSSGAKQGMDAEVLPQESRRL